MVIPWANKPAGVSPRPAPPRSAPPPRAAVPRPACGTSGFWILQIPGHTSYEKVLQKTKLRRSMGEQPGTKRACGPVHKPVVNSSSIARCVPPSVYTGFRMPMLPRRRTSRAGVFGALESKTNSFFFTWAHRPAAVLGASARCHPIPPRRAPPRPLCPPPASPLCAAAPRPARGMSGFGPDRLMVARYIFPGHALHEKGLQFPDILGMRRVCRDKKASIY